MSDAIRFLEDAGWDAFRQQSHDLARLARNKITALTGLEALVPDTAEWYGSMIALPLPDPPAGSPASIWTENTGLQAKLWSSYGIEVPIVSWNNRRLIRVSCHLYTSAAEIERLARALGDLLRLE